MMLFILLICNSLCILAKAKLSPGSEIQTYSNSDNWRPGKIAKKEHIDLKVDDRFDSKDAVGRISGDDYSDMDLENILLNHSFDRYSKPVVNHIAALYNHCLE